MSAQSFGSLVQLVSFELMFALNRAHSFFIYRPSDGRTAGPDLRTGPLDRRTDRWTDLRLSRRFVLLCNLYENMTKAQLRDFQAAVKKAQAYKPTQRSYRLVYGR